MKKALRRYSLLNKAIYSRLANEVRNHYVFKGQGIGEDQIQLEKLEEDINLLKRIEDLVTQIIDYKIRSKKDFIELFRRNKRTFDSVNLGGINICDSNFIELNQLSPLISLFHQSKLLLQKRAERFEKNGKDISINVLVSRKGYPVPLLFIFFCNLIRRHYRFYYKDGFAGYSEHYRRVKHELLHHHSCLVGIHGKVYSYLLRLPIQSNCKCDITEAEIDNNFLILKNFLNKLRKNEILQQKIGYVVSRSIISEESPGISIILFFNYSTVREHSSLTIINEAYRYWAKVYNKEAKDSSPIEIFKQNAIGINQVLSFDTRNLASYVAQYSAPLALRGDAIRSKNNPQRKKYYSKSEKL